MTTVIGNNTEDRSMRKIFLIINALLAAFLFVSCSVNELDDNRIGAVDGGTFTITAQSESGTATRAGISGNDIEGYDVVWEKGDDIYAYAPMAGTDYYTGALGVSSGMGTTTAGFSSTRPINPDAIIWAPASLGGDYHLPEYLTWPSVQTYSEDYMISGIPMFCTDVETTADSQRLQFKNLGGLLRFTLSGAEDMVLTGIELSSSSPLAGEFSIGGSGTDYPSAMLKTDSYYSEPSHSILLNVPSVALNAEGKPFYLALAPGKYDGVQVKFLFADKAPVVKRLSRPLVIDRAQITPASVTIPSPGALKGLVNDISALSQSQTISFIEEKIASGIGFNAGMVDFIFGNTLRTIIPDKTVYQAKIEYYTPAPDGNLTVASGIVAWTSDVNTSKTYSRIVSVQHGTCDVVNAPSELDFSVELAPLFQKNGDKYDNVVVLADYLGYGSSRTSDLQTPYMHGYYSASPCADMLMAAEAFLRSHTGFSYSDTEAETKPIALCGYSQGGQTTMATLFELQDRGYTSRVIDVKAGAGPHNLVSFLDRFKAQAGVDYKTTGYLPYMIRGILYGEQSDIPLTKLLAPEVFMANDNGVTMADQFSSTMLGTWHEGLGYDVTKVLHPDFFKEDGQRDPAVDEFIRLAGENSTINMGTPANPGIVTLYHETEDDQVPYDCSVTASEKWGCKLENLTIANDNHFLGAIEFFLKYLGGNVWDTAYEALKPILDILL